MPASRRSRGGRPRDASLDARILSETCALLAAREAWAHAGSPEVDGQRLSVSVSPGMGLVRSVIDTWETLRGGGPRRVLPTAVPALMPNAPAAAVGIELGARGGIHAPVSACASGAEAIAYGADLIALGRADVVVAGGTDSALSLIHI